MRIEKGYCRVRWRSFTWAGWDCYHSAIDSVIDVLVCTDFDASCIDSWFPTNSEVYFTDVQLDMRELFFHD